MSGLPDHFIGLYPSLLKILFLELMNCKVFIIDVANPLS